ncbi:MAG: hypothetical protein AB7O97_12390 [Planctomycetota bacterium]
MSPDLNRLKQLLGRLRELELRLPTPHEEGILEISRMAVREEVTRLAHALHDHSYWRSQSERDSRAC